MLWVRGIVFTVLVPGLVGIWIPHLISTGSTAKEGFWRLGWILVLVGAAVYVLCLVRFLVSGGTPTIFFTRHLRFLIGEEPPKLVRDGLYRVTRNPMYIGVLLVVLGQAVIFGSAAIAVYAIGLWLFFHITVVLMEEPHLRKQRGPSYDEYCTHVPRSLGRPR